MLYKKNYFRTWSILCHINVHSISKEIDNYNRKIIYIINITISLLFNIILLKNYTFFHYYIDFPMIKKSLSWWLRQVCIFIFIIKLYSIQHPVELTVKKSKVWNLNYRVEFFNVFFNDVWSVNCFVWTNVILKHSFPL